MSANVRGFVPAFTRTWVRLYTAGLLPEVRDARRAEIESDLWEQREAARASGEATAFELFFRLLLGVPADLSWRLEQRRGRNASREPDVPRAVKSRPSSWREKGWLTLTLLFAVLYLGLGVAGLTRFIYESQAAESPPPGLLVFSIVLLSLGSTILAGLRIMKRFPTFGGTLVVIGNAPVIVMGGLVSFYILPLVVVIPAIFSAAGAVMKAQKFTKERDGVGLRGLGSMFMLGSAVLVSIPAALVAGLVFTAIVLAFLGTAGWLVLAVLTVAVVGGVVRSRRVGEGRKAAQQDRLSGA